MERAGKHRYIDSALMQKLILTGKPATAAAIAEHYRNNASIFREHSPELKERRGSVRSGLRHFRTDKRRSALAFTENLRDQGYLHYDQRTRKFHVSAGFREAMELAGLPAALKLRRFNPGIILAAVQGNKPLAQILDELRVNARAKWDSHRLRNFRAQLRRQGLPVGTVYRLPSIGKQVKNRRLVALASQGNKPLSAITEEIREKTGFKWSVSKLEAFRRELKRRGNPVLPSVRRAKAPFPKETPANLETHRKLMRYIRKSQFWRPFNLPERLHPEYQSRLNEALFRIVPNVETSSWKRYAISTAEGVRKRVMVEDLKIRLGLNSYSANILLSALKWRNMGKNPAEISGIIGKKADLIGELLALFDSAYRQNSNYSA